MKYKLVIFDLDGTILNTIGDLWSSCNYALEIKGLPSVTIEQVKSYIGNGIKNLMQLASKNRGNVEELLDDFKFHYQKNYNALTKPYDGIEDVFAFCKEKGIFIGVLTNKVEEIARKLVEEHFPKIMTFVYGEVTGRPRKPDPTFLLKLISAYGLSKDEVLYIGDSEVDIKTCKQAKIDGLFVSYGYRKKEELLKETSWVVDHPKEIIQYLGED
ncbi:MAG: HAD family hydrolase [Anaeroplasmataceae bacterium]|nr:HAD family hydrolase [Anaeroplasmataceae bacterium]